MAQHTCSIDGCDKVVVGRKLCRNHYQKAWKAGEFVNNPLPARVPGRVVCPPGHKHADMTTCYIQHQCRCVPCKANNASRERQRTRDKAYGRYDIGLVDAEPVREHMMMLSEFGMGYKHIARLAGIGITPARTLIWGRQDPGPRYGEMQKRVKASTAQALLSVKPSIDNLAGGALVPARATTRRIQALITIGWSQSKLGNLLGIEPGNFGSMLKADRVTVARHLAVAELYEKLWNTLPPHEEWRDKIAFNRSTGYAKARRWLPPLAWDDIDTDVEPPEPDEDHDGIDHVLVELACAGDHVRLTPLERRAAVTILHAAHHSDAAIAERLHINARTSLRIRQELGLGAAVGADGEIIHETAVA